jgi:hypothetical protein
LGCKADFRGHLSTNFGHQQRGVATSQWRTIRRRGLDRRRLRALRLDHLLWQNRLRGLSQCRRQLIAGDHMTGLML